MKKKIPIEKVIVGMYVDSLGKDWMKHNFLRNSFLIKDEAILQKLKSSKLKEVVIDTEKGLDVRQEKTAEPEKQVAATHEIKDEKPLFPTTTAADIKQAKKAFKMASKVVDDLMNDVRSGKALDKEKAKDSAEQIIKSIDSSPHTLTAVTRIKNRDEYTFQHSVGVATLLAGFAKHMDYSADQLEEITVGGIIHDIGKVNTPDNILNKPDKLTDEEFVIMREHVTHSRDILQENGGFTQMQLDISLMHHEKPNGKGYPLGLKANEISEIGAMAAIIDVYDALSTKRVYKEAWEPSHALKSMLEWGEGAFNQPLLMQFISYLGVYPVGTWVMLKSGKIGFVLSLNEDKLRPVVQIKLDLKSRRLLNDEIDLSKNTSESIQAVASPTQYGLDEDFSI
jgi:HD-GYP domain-containing protein (c-di-GMP phosphodiesterase class II)